MEPDRLADIRAGDSNNMRSWGSGYLLSSWLVLTARHVLAAGEQGAHRLGVDGGADQWWQRIEVIVGHPERTQVRRAGRVCWADPNGLDVALLYLDQPVDVQGALVRWGRLSGRGLLRYAGLGYPRLAEYDDAVRGVEQLYGVLPPLATGVGGAYVLDQDVWPLRDPGGARAWSGVSGSAVFCNDALVAIVFRDDQVLGNRRLHALPAHVFATEPGFVNLLERHGDGRPHLIDIWEPTIGHGVGAGVGEVGPVVVGVVPRVADCFQRRLLIEELDCVLASGYTAVQTDAPGGQGVLVGTGGVGKTQLAAYLVDRELRCQAVDAVVWIPATAGRDAVVAGYAAAGVRLAGADPADPQNACAEFLAWLRETRQRWLVVLDDVTDPDHVRGLWPPEQPDGRVVATTRCRDAALTGARRRRLDVDVFTPAEADDYLTQALAVHGYEDDPEAVSRLTRKLGYLPIALAQAAAYLVDDATTCAAYQDLLADRTQRLADLAPHRLPDDQPAPVAAMWDVTVERAEATTPVGLARPMLHLMCLLDPAGIPETVLTSQAALAYLAAERTRTQESANGGDGKPVVVTAQHARAALRVLHRLSLADHTPAPNHDKGKGQVRVHALVQRATQDTLASDHVSRLAVVAADALLQAWPSVENDPALSRVLRANTTLLDACAQDALWAPNGHALLFRAGQSLGESGATEAAADYFHTLRATATRVLGADHPDTLLARHNLAYWRGRAGDAAGAAEAFAELLTHRSRVLGPDHRDTLATRDQLAMSRGRIGDAAGAAEAFAELLTHRSRVLGPDHRDTLATRRQLASWRGRAGDAAHAAAAYGTILADHLRVLGADHPDTLLARHNLAYWRGEAGDPEGATAAFAELLADHLRVLGADHPDTLLTRHNLAHWRGEAGDAEGAAAALAELLTDHLRVLGPDDPHTLGVRHHLAHWRGNSGDPEGAAAAFAEVLIDRARVFGNDHPRTLDTRRQLARWCGEAGDGPKAVQHLEILIDDCARILGPKHPETLDVREEFERLQRHFESSTESDT